MINLSGIMGIPLLKKSRFTGSDGELRYLLEKRSGEEGDKLAAVYWIGEKCSDATPEEDKTVQLFPFTDAGLRDAQAWLNERLSGGNGNDRKRDTETMD